MYGWKINLTVITAYQSFVIIIQIIIWLVIRTFRMENGGGGGSKFQTNSTIFCRSEYCTCTRMYPINDNCHVLWFGLHRNLRNKWTHFSPWLYTTVSYFAYKLNIEMIQDFLRILLLTFILDNICKLDNIQQLYIKRGKKDLYWQILVSHDQCGENALHLFLWSL